MATFHRISLPAAKTEPREANDIKVGNIEIIQTLQENGAESASANTSCPVPLFTGKFTLARVFFDGLTDPGGIGAQKMRGTLQVAVSGEGENSKVGSDIQLEVESLNQFVSTGDFHSDTLGARLNLENSLNFEFRLSDLCASGGLPVDEWLRVTFSLTNLFINEKPVAFDGAEATDCVFDPGKALKLHMLGYRYTDEDETVYFPEKEHFKNIHDSIENLYPINRCISSYVVVDADPEFTLPFTDVDDAEPDWEWYYKISFAHAQLLAHRTLDIDANLIFKPKSGGGKGKVDEINPRSRETWYYGVADYPDDDFFRGAASGIQNAGEIDKHLGNDGRAPANFDYVACGPVEDAGGLYAAHEIAHCLDLHHPGIGDQYRVEEEYPFVEGFVSIDRYPDESQDPEYDLFKDPKLINQSNIAEFVRLTRRHSALINNKTLRRIVDRYRLTKYQGPGNEQANLDKLREELLDWQQARGKYGVEHHGLGWHNWRYDREIIRYDENYDFMGYLDPRWISPFSYLKLRDNINKYKEDKTFEGSFGDPPNICIIGLYNENLGTGAIKYVFRTHESPSENPNENIGSVQLWFDNLMVKTEYIHHKDRNNNRLGDPLFDRAGIFKCVIEDKGYLVNEKGNDVKAPASKAEHLYLYVAQLVSDENGNGKASSTTRLPKSYKSVHRKVLINKDDGSTGKTAKQNEKLCDCDRQPFQIYRSTAEAEESEFFLKFTGEASADCSYIAQARFFDRELFERTGEIGLTGWMTLGANFRSAQYLYIDKNHCLLPGSAVDSILQFLFEDPKQNIDWKQIVEDLEPPFDSIYEYYRAIETAESRVPDIFALAVELVCMSGLDRTRVFKGLIIEKPKAAGEFYFINSEDKTYDEIRKRFEDVSNLEPVKAD